jgi:hypothetical protein
MSKSGRFNCLLGIGRLLAMRQIAAFCPGSRLISSHFSGRRDDRFCHAAPESNTLIASRQKNTSETGRRFGFQARQARRQSICAQGRILPSACEAFRGPKGFEEFA